MSNFFQFESDFVDSLRCIPMQVRLKLDTCGIKLKLQQWNKFNPEQRQKLVEYPCITPVEITNYRQFLQDLILECTGSIASELPIESNPPWLDAANIPDSVQTKTQELQVKLTVKQWEVLTPLQRFALIKLSKSGHENSNFLPALKEFNLLSETEIL